MPDQLRLDVSVVGGDAALRQLDALDAKLKGVPASAQQTAAATTALGQSVAQASTHVATLERSMLALGTSLSPLPSHFNAVTSAALSVGGITPALAGVTVGVGLLTAGLGASVAASMQFQTEMGALRAILPKREVDEFGGALGDLALTLGQKTVFSSTQAIEAFGNLARSGVSAKDIIGGVGEAALNMAAAMGGTPKEAALTLGAAMREFNIPATQATHVADQFAASVHIAGLSADEMRNGVSRVGPVANALGASLDDVITGMELLARSGLSASRAGTALAQIYEDVVNPRSKEAAALMQQLGITTDGGARSFVTASGTVKPFVEIVKILGETMKDLSPAQEAAATQTEFTRRAMQAALVAVNAYKNGGLDPLITTQHEARDAASAMQERLDNLPGSMKLLESSVATLATQLGNDLSPALRHVADDAKIAIDGLSQFYAESKRLRTEAEGQGTHIPSGLPEVLTGAQGAVTQAFNSGMGGLITAIETETAPTIAQSLVNGLQEQRIGERLAPILSHETYLAGQAAGEAVADGLEAARPSVINASARIASEIGAALQSNRGNIEAAIAEMLTIESGPAAVQATAQILQRANAYKAVNEVLNTLTPVERAQYEVLLLANGANDKVNQSLNVLNTMRDQGKITAEQYTNAIERGSVGLERHTTAARAAATAIEQVAAAQEAVIASASRSGFGGVSMAAGALGGSASGTGAADGPSPNERAYNEAVHAATRRNEGGGGYTVNSPFAPFVQAYLERHPERYLDPTDFAAGGGGYGIEANRQRDLNVMGRLWQEASQEAAYMANEAGAAAVANKQRPDQTRRTFGDPRLTQEQANANWDLFHGAFWATQGQGGAGGGGALAGATQTIVQSFEAGSGAARRLVEDFRGFGVATDTMRQHMEELTRAIQADWQAREGQAAALQQGALVNAGVAGGRTAAGLTYGQIYGNSPTYGGMTPGSSIAGRPLQQTNSLSVNVTGNTFQQADVGYVTAAADAAKQAWDWRA